MQVITSPIDDSSKTIYWFRVHSFTAGATYSLDGENPIVIVGAEPRAASRVAPFKRITLTGTVTVEIGTDPDEPFWGWNDNPNTSASTGLAGGLAPSTDGSRAAQVDQVTDVGAVSTPAIYDQTINNTLLDTGILDLTPWRQIDVTLQVVVGGPAGAFACFQIDDTGAQLTVAFLQQAAPSGLQMFSIGPGCAILAAVLPAGTSNMLSLPRRLQFTVQGTLGCHVRLRIEGRR
jgi:hypothetical protein